MSLPDAAAAAALDEAVVNPIYFVFMDFAPEPLRATSMGTDVTISGSSQPDLNGDYIGVDPRFVSVSPIKVTPGGSDTVTARLSGIRGLDDDDRIMLADPANWQGRVVRMWRVIRDGDNVQRGGIQHYYTGYMMALTHVGSASELMLEISIESYLAAFGQASGRTYLDQEDFDEGDLSARAALAIANGNTSSPLISGASNPGWRTADNRNDPRTGAWR